MKNTLPIIYNGGAYGTYLEWVLRTLFTSIPIHPPFTATGNSHATQTGFQCLNMQEWRTYVASARQELTVRMHAKTHKNEFLAKNLNEILDSCGKSILIYPDKQSQLLCINNWLTKIYVNQDIYHGPLGDLDMSLIYDNFPISRSQPIPRWIQREHLSFYLVPAWRAQIDWFLPDHWSDERCMIIFVHELLWDFKNVIDRIRRFWNQEAVKSLDDLLPLHHHMLALQAHINQDRLCESIIASVISDVGWMAWDDLPLGSESWIQWRLRELGYEIRCHDLDDFPTDTATMKSLVYRTQ